VPAEPQYASASGSNREISVEAHHEAINSKTCVSGFDIPQGDRIGNDPTAKSTVTKL
jgi:hypothetical protein